MFFLWVFRASFVIFLLSCSEPQPSQRQNGSGNLDDKYAKIMDDGTSLMLADFSGTDPIDCNTRYGRPEKNDIFDLSASNTEEKSVCEHLKSDDNKGPFFTTSWEKCTETNGGEIVRSRPSENIFLCYALKQNPDSNTSPFSNSLPKKKHKKDMEPADEPLVNAEKISLACVTGVEDDSWWYVRASGTGSTLWKKDTDNTCLGEKTKKPEPYGGPDCLQGSSKQNCQDRSISFLDTVCVTGVEDDSWWYVRTSGTGSTLWKKGTDNTCLGGKTLKPEPYGGSDCQQGFSKQQCIDNYIKTFRLTPSL